MRWTVTSRFRSESNGISSIFECVIRNQRHRHVDEGDLHRIAYPSCRRVGSLLEIVTAARALEEASRAGYRGAHSVRSASCHPACE